jgi:uncharacterized RDD family membrane protein YckC
MSQNPVHDSEGFRVVFLGLVNPSDEEIQAFAERLSAAFKISPEKALRITKKTPIVIKKGISRSKAERYEQALKKLGGKVRIEKTDPFGLLVAEDPSPDKSSERAAVESEWPPAQARAGDPRELAQTETNDTPGSYHFDITSTYQPGGAPPGPDSSEPPAVPPFHCPQCGAHQERGDECIKCGIIFEKLERMAEAESRLAAGEEQEFVREGLPPKGFEVKIEPAGFWIRLGAYFVDYFLFGLINLGLAIVYMILVVGGAALTGFRNPLAMIGALLPLFGLSVLLYFAYNVYFLGKKGATPGKSFLGLQVIRQDETGVTYMNALIRTLLYYLSAFVLCLGFLWIGFTRKKRGWHDMIAGTQVITAEVVPAWRKWIIAVPVILLLGGNILYGVMGPLRMAFSSRAHVAEASADMQVVKNHLEEHYYRYDKYPMTGEFRTFLRTILGRIPADPFNPGQPFRYESDGLKYTLWSLGPDRVDDGGTVPYDPFMRTGRQKAGDIILYSDEGQAQDGELFGMVPEEKEQWLSFSD